MRGWVGPAPEVLPGDLLEFGPHVVRVTKLTYDLAGGQTWEGVDAAIELLEKMVRLETITEVEIFSALIGMQSILEQTRG